MKKSRKHVLLAIGILTPLVTVASSRSIPGIDLIFRHERGAQESRKYVESGRYNNAIARKEAYKAWVAGEGEEQEGFQAWKEADEKEAARYSFLVNKYPEDIATDKTITKEGNKTLVWSQQIVAAKRKLIVHHTADSYTYDTIQDVDAALQDFYELHTLKKGRGDIGYNFLIDPFGNVYEGRSGGQGVVGAHADWNNASTIGVALMGNFETSQPTAAMWRSLVDLATSLGYTYNIWPEKSLPYYTAIAQEPYLEISHHQALAGHKDTKNTACPGTNVYEKLPMLRKEVTARMNRLAINGIKKLTNNMFKKRVQPFVVTGPSPMIWFESFNDANTVSCETFSDDLMLGECFVVGDKIIVPMTYQGVGSSGVYTIGIKQGTQLAFVEFGIARQEELAQSLIEKKYNRIAAQGITEPTLSEKSIAPISINQANAVLRENISVLLYELTTAFDTRIFRCEGSCIAMAGGQTFTDPSTITVTKSTSDMLNVSVDGQQISSSNFGISSSGGMIVVENYLRKTGAYPLNMFRGSITITKSTWRHLDYGEQTGFAVVNTLPFAQYMLGIGEGSESQHFEKLKTLAVLAKQYALRYTAGQNRHPSVPVGVGYTAVDDPRIFQRYVGAGRESFATNRADAVQTTQNTLVTYNETLPILPYFHCSAGFTRSGKEKRGRTDTPWLTGTLDPKPCASGQFEGHGVGLSGDGAEAMAQAGVSMKDILLWFYDGVVVE